MSWFRSRAGALAAASVLLVAAHDPVAFVSLDGEPVQLAPAPGQALVAHFWATWCPSCVEELAELDAAAARCRNGRVRIVAVNVGESPQEIRAWLAENPLSLEVLRDPKGAVWRSLSGEGLPANATWSGGERRVDVGPRSAADWRAELARLGCDGG